MLWQGEDSTAPWIGKVIASKYRIIEAIGRGGMGRVFVAEQKMGKVTRKVALKTLHPDLASDPAVTARFNREAETVIRLSHPNTITFFDFGQTPEGILYIVMELIEGVSLARVIEQGPMEPDRIEHILSQICSSLHEAHELGIVHRDLKPENVILTRHADRGDFVKLLDFGIAKRTELDTDSLKLTQAGVVLGTPPYMSPEQFAGQGLDRRSDIYSLGVLTYEMLTGELPFKATTPWEWATKHMSLKPPAIPDRVAGRSIPESYRRTVRHALAKEAEERPATTLELINELRGAGMPRDNPPSLLTPSDGLLEETAPSRVTIAHALEIPGPSQRTRSRRRALTLVSILVIIAATLLVTAEVAGLIHLGLISRPKP